MPRLNLKTKFITSYRILHAYLGGRARKQFLMNSREVEFQTEFCSSVIFCRDSWVIVLVTCILWAEWLTNMPSRPCFLEVYLISGLVLLRVILQWHLGTRWGDLWHHFLSPSPHPSARPQVISQSVSKPLEGEGLVCLLPGSCSCVLLLVWFRFYWKHGFWALFLVLGPTGNCPVVTSPLDLGAFLSFFLSFLLRLVVGVPHHEKQKYKRDEKVGDIDSYQE